MSDAYQLDRHRARSVDEQRVIELRNEGQPWRAIAAALGHTQGRVRRIWNAANHHQRGAKPEPVRSNREDATIGNEALLRGIPVAGVGGGAINGTRPGNPTWPLERERRRTPRKQTA